MNIETIKAQISQRLTDLVREIAEHEQALPALRGEKARLEKALVAIGSEATASTSARSRDEVSVSEVRRHALAWARDHEGSIATRLAGTPRISSTRLALALADILKRPTQTCLEKVAVGHWRITDFDQFEALG